ncbi:ABC transporter substrate-binding protein [Streptosporangium sp. 'caverna']|uniref:ABC transporter substrate-binding protein n=1 Tax=Streptosporangium sp. 'caverna' TaxID=2202249 RepID=UPI000D7D8E39|nr:sugar ABC transporter substrate-binding protein [Streptosporangium sp. 'caverna']AWS41766.1 sugar ABC transporter substrate-binding protein [Streptosporangium sp. 'caverna']
MKPQPLAAGISAVLLAAALTACGGNSDSGGGTGAGDGAVTLTYWASNQGASLDNDKQILTPELDKFTQQTGIKVKLEVVPWTDLTNNTLSAAVSGQGPDVLNIGNTNAATFQSTGAFYPFDDAALQKIGGKDRFVESAFAASGVAGTPPTSIPLYSQVYALYYNKKLFSDAGLQPPATWEDLVAAAQKLTKPAEKKYGIVLPGATVNASMHFAYIFSEQNGGSAFDQAGKPTFTTPGMLKGLKQYVDLLSQYHVVNPSAAQYTDSAQAAGDFARGNAAMYMAQTSGINVLTQNGMKPDQYGIVPIPAPASGTKISSFVAGTNISIFKNTKNLDAALQFVKFMTSDEEQQILNKAYTTQPTVKGASASFTDDQEKLDAFTKILSDYSKPLPIVPAIQAFQANVGGAAVALIARAATGATIGDADVKAALEEAQQKMGAS